MATTSDGGPAFPSIGAITPEGDKIVWQQGGLSLRDYFAAAALTGLLANSSAVDIITRDADKIGAVFGEHMAETALLFADAMLRAREQEGAK